jgi:hypothetical protein
MAHFCKTLKWVVTGNKVDYNYPMRIFLSLLYGEYNTTMSMGT